MDILLGDKTRRQLQKVESSAGGYIFYGQAGVGKRTAALHLAQKLNCRSKTNPGEDGCPRCGQIIAGSYPDLVLADPGEEASIGVAVVREITQKLTAKPYYVDSVRFLIIDQADLLTPAAQNALLKLIEEPPPRTRVILATFSLESLLPTVRSRLAAVYFPPLRASVVSQWLVKAHGVKSAEAAAAADLAAGPPGLALKLAGDAAAAKQLILRQDQSANLLSGELFVRLNTARALAEAKTDLFSVAATLQRQMKSNLNSGIITPEAAASQLAAVEKLRTMLQAGVSGRVALETFVIGAKSA